MRLLIPALILLAAAGSRGFEGLPPNPGAELRLYADEAAWGEVHVQLVNDVLDKPTPTYNTRPGTGERLTALDMLDGWNTIPLDPAWIGNLIDDPSLNHGCRLEDTEQPIESNGCNDETHSREHAADPSEHIVTYSGRGLETAGRGAVKARDD
ncbi:MAG: hypothetical protein GF399_11560 [Candidatus Coatesbacteria bacterium]|nr:hypothetical protein [Candidatus Coatesbacteria bacterium]